MAGAVEETSYRERCYRSHSAVIWVFSKVTNAVRVMQCNKFIPETDFTRVTNKYGNLTMCYVDNVVIATPRLENYVQYLDEKCMHKKAGPRCEPSKSQLLMDLITYLGIIVEWTLPGTEHGREFVQCYADKLSPNQRLMREEKDMEQWGEKSFLKNKKKLCETPILGMLTENILHVRSRC